MWTLDNTRHTNLSFNHLLSCYTFGLEPIRAINNLIVDLLNVTGDVRYPVTVSVVTTWLLLLPGSYLLGFIGD